MSATPDDATHPGTSPQPSVDFVHEPAPPPHPAVLLGLAFGASAGLMTALYLLFF